jgi:hypothetical protein
MSSKKTPAKKSPAKKNGTKARKQPTQAEIVAAQPAPAETTTPETAAAETAPVEQPATAPVEPVAADEVAEANATPKAKKARKEKPASVEQRATAPVEQAATENTPVESAAAPGTDAVANEEKPKAKGRAKKEQASPKPKKLSAIDAAAKLLAETGQAMNCHEMVEAMAKKGLWTSPGGQTPHATLYSAILREIGKKGKEARFTKTERGKFATA